MKKYNWLLISGITATIVGLFNTLLIKPEDIGTWKNYLGYALLIIGFIDLLFIIIKKVKQ